MSSGYIAVRCVHDAETVVGGGDLVATSEAMTVAHVAQMKGSVQEATNEEHRAQPQDKLLHELPVAAYRLVFHVVLFGLDERFSTRFNFR